MPETQPNLTASTFQAARKVWATSMVRGGLFLVLGVVMFLWTHVALDVLTWLLAAVLWLQALILLVEAQRLGAGPEGGPAAERGTGRTWRFVLAAVAVLAGIAVVVWPDRSVSLVLRVLAVWALVAGVIGTASAVRAYRVRRPAWAWALTTSLLWLVFGVLVLVKPLDDLPAVAVVLSVYLIVTGIVLLVSGFALHTAARDAAKADTPVVTAE